MSGSSETFVLRNDLAELGPLAEFVEGFCSPLSPTPQDEMAMQLSLEEMVTNVINHGYVDGRSHNFTVTLSALPDRLVRAVITDDAPAFDPLSRPPADLSAPLYEREVGGLGVHLLRKLMDSVHYEYRDGMNVLTFERTFGRAR